MSPAYNSPIQNNLMPQMPCASPIVGDLTTPYIKQEQFCYPKWNWYAHISNWKKNYFLTFEINQLEVQPDAIIDNTFQHFLFWVYNLKKKNKQTN